MAHGEFYSKYMLDLYLDEHVIVAKKKHVLCNDHDLRKKEKVFFDSAQKLHAFFQRTMVVFTNFVSDLHYLKKNSSNHHYVKKQYFSLIVHCHDLTWFSKCSKNFIENTTVK